MRRRIVYDPQHDYYALLGVSADASPEEIRQAYRQCVRELHPDLNPDRADWATRQLQHVNEAYDVLREPLLRRQYDQARRGQALAAPPRPRHTVTRPAAGPWWQQAAEQSARARAYEQQASAAALPVWLLISAWLRRGRLRGLEPLWLTLVGLWRGPYAQVLLALSVALALNIAFIVHALLNPNNTLINMPGLFGADAPPTPSLTPLPNPTPDRLYQTCLNPDARISSPASGEVVGDSFPLIGTVSLEDLWAYAVEIGYLGPSQPRPTAPAQWLPVRTPPAGQTIPEPPVIDGPLTETPLDLSGQPAGFYALRLRVVLRDSLQMTVCDVVVQHLPH